MRRIGSAKRWNKPEAVSIVFLILIALCACAKKEVPEPTSAADTGSTGVVKGDAALSAGSESTETETETPAEHNSQQIPTTKDIPMKTELILKIGGQPISVLWEENESVAALRDLVSKKPLNVQMSMYGGFEQVGSIGTSLPRNDVRTTATAGDIVLYSGNQIVLFYGSNSWSYTRLGRVSDRTADELTELLGSGNVALTLTMK